METENQKKEAGAKKLLQLFISNLYISAFTFGGGFVIVSLMKKKFVDELHWIDDTEMMDLTALAQSGPGAIAVNASILVGWKIAGLAGMVTSVLATIIPPMVILSVVSYFYAIVSTNVYIAILLKGMQAGVAAVIFDVVCSLAYNVWKLHQPVYLVLMAAAFAANVIFHVNVIYIILAAGLSGVILAILHRGRNNSAKGERA